MNIIFMGTPYFAVPTLQALINSTKHNVVGVFTRMPQARGRGMKVRKSPVHELAIANKLIVYTPKTLKNQQTIELIENINAEIIVVVAYGFIIPENILVMKKYGCLNIHPSDLPKYRGASPLQRTIINGEKETAVCIIQMDKGLDTGDIILKKDFTLSPKITFLDLQNKCADIGGELLMEVLDNIRTLPRIRQSKDFVSYAHKLKKEEGRVNWQESAYKINCKIRAMNPWPGVYFKYGDKLIKILSAEYTNNKHSAFYGELLNKNFEVACGKGTLIIKSLKPEGKATMSAQDYICGIRASARSIIFS